jgi:Mg2+-importing ATPase
MSIKKVRLRLFHQDAQNEPQRNPTFWHTPIETLLTQLGTTSRGLSSAEAKARLTQTAKNKLNTRRRSPAWRLLLAQFESPIILILLFATVLSFFVHDHVGALIILAIVLVSGLLGFWQEHGAANAVEKLLALVQVKTTVLRDSKTIQVPATEIVPGDVITLQSGSSIPGDSLILESNDLFINEASLTGETYPVEKSPAILPAETPLNARSNTLFMGTNVVSGSATAVTVLTGRDTEFGQVSAHLQLKPPETEFESGIRHFGYLLMEVTLFLVIGIFAVNVYLARPVLDSFLFALALAVGLTPQLLPAIISINLAHGARNMAERKVIVKRLASIENFGSMNVLCSDKTGTLTEGVVTVQGAFDINGKDNTKVLLHAYLNASFETGFANPIDQAIRSFKPFDISSYQKVGEVPYDFIRKRLSIVIDNADARLMVTKGALSNVLDVCSLAETPSGVVDLAEARETIDQHFARFSSQGLRTLGIAYRSWETSESAIPRQESAMTFLGFIVLADPPKPDIVETIGALRNLGVTLKMITGDNRLVAAHVGQQVGLSNAKVLSGPELYHLSDEALRHRVLQTDIFAEIEPNQKERIILALKKAGNVVGYMGDGINDASALHAADVGISVSSAVDVAKEAADIVLLEQDLKVLLQGVRGGRETFANTLKYVFMATSANFGNMFSMAGASLFLPFLPLLPKQVLLTNFLTDFPEMTIATDAVDAESLEQPRRWNIDFIRRFMLSFGIISSVFDYLTFGILLFLLHAKPTEFRTGWFIESVISASVIVLVIRTKRPFYQSKPGRALMGTTLLIVVLTVILPFTPLGRIFGFGPIPPSFLLALGVIMVLYISLAEIAKHYFYRFVRF